MGGLDNTTCYRLFCRFLAIPQASPACLFIQETYVLIMKTCNHSLTRQIRLLTAPAILRSNPRSNSNIELAYTFNETMTQLSAKAYPIPPTISTLSIIKPGISRYEFIANAETSDEGEFQHECSGTFYKMVVRVIIN